MPDRLQEIRARLDAATPGPWRIVKPLAPVPRHHHIIAADKRASESHQTGRLETSWFDAELIAHAPADIAWLLAEVERLRNTKASLPNPLCDEPVAQDVTKLQRS